MCRLLAVVSSETTDFTFSLHEAPRSLSKLSAEHPHGWGLAVHCEQHGWDLHKHAATAGECAYFRDVAARARGELLVAHVRKRTVGPISVENTHPFRRGPWVFAHNGTIEDVAWMRSRTSAAREAEVQGDTDSERFFAMILTRLDEAGEGAPIDAVDRALRVVVEEALSRPKLGAANFLLSNGRAVWAFRSGRTLHLLERKPHDPVRVRRVASETDATIDTPWTPRRHAFLVASERISDEPWRELPEGSLLRIDAASPQVAVLR